VSGKRRDLTADEKKLWRRVASNVKTRRPPEPETEDVSEPPKRAAKAPISAPAAPSKAPAPKRAPPPPADRGNEKRVRRGQVEPTASLDLHGHTQDTGRAAVRRFLMRAHRRGDRAVIVITGVGRAGEGVMKKRLPEWLAERDVREIVSGFAQAHRAHGGAGAFYVFLKRVRADD
jgi:DNA-nicking Smr family endonuclease